MKLRSILKLIVVSFLVVLALIYRYYKLDLIDLKGFITLVVGESVAGGIITYFAYVLDTKSKAEEIKISDKTKTIETLEAHLEKHNRNIITVFEKWFIESSISSYSNYDYKTPLASVYLEVHSKSKKDEPKEPSVNAIEHLKADDYTYVRDLWNVNCKEGSNDLLDLTIKMWEEIKIKLISNPFFSSLTECELLENNPTQIGYYDLKATVRSIYEKAEYYSQTDKLSEPWIHKNDLNGFFEIGVHLLCARVTTKIQVDEFTKIFNDISTSPDIIKQLKTRDLKKNV